MSLLTVSREQYCAGIIDWLPTRMKYTRELDHTEKINDKVRQFWIITSQVESYEKQ